MTTLITESKEIRLQVGPHHNEGPRDWENLFARNMRFVLSRSLSIYFSIIWVKKIVWVRTSLYISRLVISRIHYKYRPLYPYRDGLQFSQV